jgi:hypothetical protein
MVWVGMSRGRFVGGRNLKAPKCPAIHCETTKNPHAGEIIERESDVRLLKQNIMKKILILAKLAKERATCACYRREE